MLHRRSNPARNLTITTNGIGQQQTYTLNYCQSHLKASAWLLHKFTNFVVGGLPTGLGPCNMQPAWGWAKLQEPQGIGVAKSRETRGFA